MMAAQQMPANPFQLRLTSTQIEDAKREWSQASSDQKDEATKQSKAFCEECELFFLILQTDCAIWIQHLL